MTIKTEEAVAWLKRARYNPGEIAVLADALADGADPHTIRQVLLFALGLAWDVDVLDMNLHQLLVNYGLRRQDTNHIVNAVGMSSPAVTWEDINSAASAVLVGHAVALSGEDLQTIVYFAKIGPLRLARLREALASKGLRLRGDSDEQFAFSKAQAEDTRRRREAP